MGTDTKMLLPPGYEDLFSQLAKWFGSAMSQGGGSSPTYGGQLWAGYSPYFNTAGNLLQQRAMGGSPQAWNSANSFINMYSNPFAGGVYNPFTGQTQYGGGWPQGNGQMPVNGQGSLNSLLLQLMQGGGGYNSKTTPTSRK